MLALVNENHSHAKGGAIVIYMEEDTVGDQASPKKSTLAGSISEAIRGGGNAGIAWDEGRDAAYVIANVLRQSQHIESVCLCGVQLPTVRNWVSATGRAVCNVMAFMSGIVMLGNSLI